MLEYCNAYVVGATKQQTSELVDLAEGVGFVSVHLVHAEQRSPAARQPQLNFFLVHYMLSDEHKKAVLAAVRGSPDQDVRFAPVVLISDDCPSETILAYVEFGFDDIISLPETTDMLEQRLSRQLHNPQVYVETAQYLGPDRRRFEAASEIQGWRRAGLKGHTRYTILRHPEHGVEIQQKVLFA